MGNIKFIISFFHGQSFYVVHYCDEKNITVFKWYYLRFE